MSNTITERRIADLNPSRSSALPSHLRSNSKGDYAFAIQGDVNSPDKRWARIDTRTVTSTSVDDGLRQLEASNPEQVRERQQARPQPALPQPPLQQEQTPVRVIAR